MARQLEQVDTQHFHGRTAATILEPLGIGFAHGWQMKSLSEFWINEECSRSPGIDSKMEGTLPVNFNFNAIFERNSLYRINTLTDGIANKQISRN